MLRSPTVRLLSYVVLLLLAGTMIVPLWGVVATGLFADGKSNYGGSWNGVSGSVTGLFYGDAGQLIAQLIGVSALLGVVFTAGFAANLAIDFFVGQRVGAKAELEGLDLPEVGALCYPEFELKTR